MVRKFLLSLIRVIFLVLGITFLSFVLSYFSPSDPVEIALKKSGMLVTEDTIEAKREELGLNRPMLVQYMDWVGDLLQGDLGESYKTGEAVVLQLKEKIPVTILLTIFSMVLTIVLSTPLGILCAQYKDRAFDNIMRALTYLFASLPSFFIGLLFLYFFSLKLNWFPVIGSVSLAGIIMPGLVLSLTLSSWYIRQVRAIVLNELEKEYVIGLYSRGLSQTTILFKHVLKNCMIPLVTLFAISFGTMLGGSTIVESIFSWPGIGKLAVDAITARDYPIIQAYVVWMALIFLLMNYLSEILCQIFDPRIRRGYQ